MIQGNRRRTFIKSTLAALAALGGGSAARRVFSAGIEAPIVDRLSIRVLVDSSFDLFFRPAEIAGVRIERPPRFADFRRTLHNEWGLSLWLESSRAAEQRTLMLDFGYSPGVLENNMELLGVDPRKLDALIVSHGHYDHFGGLLGFLDRHRAGMPTEMRLYAGGEDNFCRRLNGTPGQFSDFGVLDRRDLATNRITTVLAEQPVLVAGHAFTTGPIQRKSIERVLPSSHVVFGVNEGAGCESSRYLPVGMDGKTVPDDHLHEHATCFHVRGKGLVVISSCGHAGIVNSVRQAQEVSGVEKVHAIVGGFHLGPAPRDYLSQIVSEIRKLRPDVLIPMHCSGLNFIQEARAQMPDALLVTTTGSRILFGA